MCREHVSEHDVRRGEHESVRLSDAVVVEHDNGKDVRGDGDPSYQN
jgi:hypothetical protein